METTKRNIVQRIAWEYLGLPYIWGGDDPTGFDCSGLVIEALKSVGVLPRKGDWTADSLYRMFKSSEVYATVQPGDLVFWENDIGLQVHVEIMVGPGLSIGASGGGSWAINKDEAFRRGAYIKVRPCATRGGKMHFVNPYPKP